MPENKDLEELDIILARDEAQQEVQSLRIKEMGIIELRLKEWNVHRDMTARSAVVFSCEILKMYKAALEEHEPYATFDIQNLDWCIEGLDALLGDD
jgi:hypothetical protein